MVSAAVLASLSLAACGHSGRSMSFGGGSGSGGIPADNGGKDPVDNSGGGSGSGSGSGGGSSSSGGSGSGSGGGPTNLTNALGKVTVGDKTVVGQNGSSGPLGVSVLSPKQNKGDLATVGVLSDGKLADVGASKPGDGKSATSLVNVNAGGKQVVGSGQGGLVGVSAGTDKPAAGSVAGVNLLPKGTGGATGGNSGSGGVVKGVLGKVTKPLKPKGH